MLCVAELPEGLFQTRFSLVPIWRYGKNMLRHVPLESGKVLLIVFTAVITTFAVGMMVLYLTAISGEVWTGLTGCKSMMGLCYR